MIAGLLGRLCLLTALLCGMSHSALAQASDRIALLIGNSKYQTVSPIPNPTNDANDLGNVLRELGFDVTTTIDGTRADMQRAIRAFAAKLEGASIALLFYAGHGVQVDGKNYLIPIDARLQTAQDVAFETIELQMALDLMMEQRPAAKRNVSLVFLDTDRDNPFAVRSTRSASKGLAKTPMDVEALIAYASSPGKNAMDGTGRNSPFTAALMKHIRTPGLDISLVLRNVRRDVVAETSGAQVPWYHSSLSDDVILVPAR